MKTKLQLFIFILLSINIFAQNEQSFNQIAQRIKQNNSQGIAAFFAPTIDMTIESIDGTYSQQQAQVLLKDFFKRHQTKSFNITHKGSSNKKTFYAVGTLVSQDKTWDVYILLNQELKIVQLQIEE
ncbi:MAG: hypothetical protein B7C24_08400 [Bacteroidetes bacterium 4572_77]|nr:MAG: hypothetical protein B7C24_08400 [Bacteroidetes bacterium 4572_77]